MYFDIKGGAVFEPKEPKLLPLYRLLEKHAPALDGSLLFEDLVEVYESLEMDLKEEENEPISRAV